MGDSNGVTGGSCKEEFDESFSYELELALMIRWIMINTVVLPELTPCVPFLLLEGSISETNLSNHSFFPVLTAIPRMLAPQFAQNFLQLFFENHTQIQCFDVKITINK